MLTTANIIQLLARAGVRELNVKIDNDTHGGPGNDLFVADFGFGLTFNGYGGSDTISYHEIFRPGNGTSLPFNVDLQNQSGNYQKLNSIENIVGSQWVAPGGEGGKAGGFGDNLFGNGLNNVILGLAGDDDINGRGGNDRLFGGTGNDILRGANGNDRLDGGLGDDVLSGGNNRDAAAFNSVAQAVTVDLSLGKATGQGNDRLISIENVIGSNLDDSLTGNDIANVIRGLNGDDFIQGLDGNDRLFGQNGDDWIIGGDGNDLIDGGHGIDGVSFVGLGDSKAGGLFASIVQGHSFFVAGDGTIDTDTLRNVENLFGTDAQAAGLGGKIGQGGDVLEGDHRANKLWGAGGNDDLSGLDGNDVLLGGSGRDFLSGGNGVDTLKGESGNDVLLGGNGRDFLYGGSGRDTLRGEAGNDVIDGGTGNDFLYGDGGGDLFVFTGNAGHDQIFDFDTHADVIDLTAYNAHVSDVSFFDGADFTTLSLGNMSVQVFGVSSGDLHFGDDILL